MFWTMLLIYCCDGRWIGHARTIFDLAVVISGRNYYSYDNN